MNRQVELERLDSLPAHDRLALRMRQDLQRINLVMGHRPIMRRLWRKTAGALRIERLIDLGAGDGKFTLKLCQQLVPEVGPFKIVLVDRQAASDDATFDGFRKLRCEVETVNAEALDWLSEARDARATAIISNLFLHHFVEERLRELFQRITDKCCFFAACEPRRTRFSLLGCRLLWAIGCNRVTRHDAAISVRAGFAKGELHRLWMPNPDWAFEEGPAGWFTWFVCAYRRNGSIGTSRV